MASVLELVLAAVLAAGGAAPSEAEHAPPALIFAWPETLTASVTLRRSRGQEHSRRDVAVFAWNSQATRHEGEVVVVSRSMQLVEPRNVPQPVGPFRFTESVRRIVEAGGKDVLRLEGVEAGLRASGRLAVNDPLAVSAATMAALQEERETWALLVGAWVGQSAAPGVEHRRYVDALRREVAFTVSEPGPCPSPSIRKNCVRIVFRTLGDAEPGQFEAAGPGAIRDVRVRIEGSVITEAHTLVPHRLHYMKRASFQIAQTKPVAAAGVDELEYAYRYVAE